jgi:hypothetical protein
VGDGEGFLKGSLPPGHEEGGLLPGNRPLRRPPPIGDGQEGEVGGGELHLVDRHPKGGGEAERVDGIPVGRRT